MESGWAFSTIETGSEDDMPELGRRKAFLGDHAPEESGGSVVVGADHQAKLSLNFSGPQFSQL